MRTGFFFFFLVVWYFVSFLKTCVCVEGGWKREGRRGGGGFRVRPQDQRGWNVWLRCGVQATRMEGVFAQRCQWGGGGGDDGGLFGKNYYKIWDWVGTSGACVGALFCWRFVQSTGVTIDWLDWHIRMKAAGGALVQGLPTAAWGKIETEHIPKN